jgi:hypothetical protein
MKKLTFLTMILAAVAALTSCYKNYYDIPQSTLNAINNVSFRNDVVPIVTSGACGCHNNGTTTNQVRFSYYDTALKQTVVFYSAIQIRDSILNAMAKGSPHPGEGSIFFTPSQAAIVSKWYEQGSKDDFIPPPITGEVTYSKHIAPLYKTDCKGSTCHGGAAVALDYNAMVNHEENLTAMMNSGGQTGHPGGPISISPTTSAYFLAWIDQGMKP